ncbi:MAG TPA: hypothetical protein GXX28_12370, partial [Firmicutes bacterium]|nr:hypothetical protein [Bacillota bacterium]
AIRGGRSIAAAYDEAMRSSDARYKVYLHDNALILEPRLLYHLLDLFADPKIGMIGITGGTRIPKSGVWYHDALHSRGYFMRHGREVGIPFIWLPDWLNPKKIRPFRYLPVLGRYTPVACVDGVFMATQHDVPWRKDLFGGFIYYEGPQCLEFIKRGYEVVVARQKRPWVLHLDPKERTREEDEAYHARFREVMEVFRREYAPFIGKHIDAIRRMVKQGLVH